MLDLRFTKQQLKKGTIFWVVTPRSLMYFFLFGGVGLNPH
jgi:hypothetical protein